MTPELSDADLNAVFVPGPLEAARIDHMTKAAQQLRLVQAWAGCYAAILETRSGTFDDLANADTAYAAAVARSGEALLSLGATLSSEGTA